MDPNDPQILLDKIQGLSLVLQEKTSELEARKEQQFTSRGYKLKIVDLRAEVEEKCVTVSGAKLMAKFSVNGRQLEQTEALCELLAKRPTLNYDVATLDDIVRLSTDIPEFAGNLSSFFLPEMCRLLLRSCLNNLELLQVFVGEIDGLMRDSDPDIMRLLQVKADAANLALRELAEEVKALPVVEEAPKPLEKLPALVSGPPTKSPTKAPSKAPRQIFKTRRRDEEGYDPAAH